MQLTTKAIVLTTIKYSDTSLIVKCFTEKAGIKTYLLKGVLKSKKGAVKAGYFQALTQLELVAIHKNKGTLERIKEVKAAYQYTSIPFSMPKNAIAMFLAEVLSLCLQEEEQNEALFTYVETALQWLDTHSEIANFHLLFLLNLSKYLGFYPETSEIENTLYFDLAEGSFTNTLSGNPVIEGENLQHFKSLLGINFDELTKVKLSQKTRQSLLDSFIFYFELHLQGFKKPKSIAVLNSVFS